MEKSKYFTNNFDFKSKTNEVKFYNVFKRPNNNINRIIITVNKKSNEKYTSS